MTADKKPWTHTIPLHSYAMQAIVSPRDAASGLPTGKRMHKPIVITLETSAATPLLARLKANETITEVKLSFTPVAAHTPSHAFVIKTIANPTHTVSNELTQIGFTFQKITWTWVNAGITASDDWETPVI